jgi:hypothetical protein
MPVLTAMPFTVADVPVVKPGSRMSFCFAGQGSALVK